MKDRTIDPKNIAFQNKSLICSVNGWNIEKPYWSSVRNQYGYKKYFIKYNP